MWNAVGIGSKKKHQATLQRLWEYLRYDRRKAEPVLPPTGEEALDFLADKADNVTAKTVATWMSSLKMALADMGADVSMFDSRQFRQFRDGVRRVKGESVARTALPLTLPLLSRFNRELLSGYPTLREVTLAAAFALAFGCFLRSGEFTYAEFDASLDLQRRDVDLTGKIPTLRIKSSKTDTTRQGKYLPIPCVPDPSYAHVCPATLLRRLLTDYPDYPEAPLLSFSGIRGKHSFPKKAVVEELRHRLQSVGVPLSVEGRSYTGHSFRRGAATWTARVGIPDTNIRILGRWSLGSIKGSFHRYIDIGIGEIAASSARMYERGVQDDSWDITATHSDNPYDPWNSVSDDDTHR